MASSFRRRYGPVWHSSIDKSEMSYHATVLRKQGKISPEEVGRALASMPNLMISTSKDNGFEVSPIDSSKLKFTLFITDGEAWVANPDRDAIGVLIDLADKLGGRVRGDEFETYRTPDETYRHPDDAAAVEAADGLSKTMWRRSRRRSFLFNLLIIIAFVLLGLLVNYISKR